MLEFITGCVIAIIIILTSIFYLIFQSISRKFIGGLDDEQKWEQFLKMNKKTYLEIINQKECPTIKYFTDIHKELQYEFHIGHSGTIIHIGQLKLMLTEIEFLTNCLEKYDQPALLVYAGSAPSNHMSCVSDLFPKTKFLLIDPNEHEIMFYDEHKKHFNHYSETFRNQVLYFKAGIRTRTKENKDDIINQYDFDSHKIIQVSRDSPLTVSFDKDKYLEMMELIHTDQKYTYYILEDFFTDDLSIILKNYKTYFCSDIRTNIGATDFSNYPIDLDILWNSAQQYIWLNNMQPLKCMLKFRCPYMNEKIDEIPTFQGNTLDKAKKMGIDFVDDYQKGIFRYFKPESIYIQSFPGPTSSETRLITSDYKTLIEFNPKEYENKLFYYNRFIRTYCFHNNKKYFDHRLGLDACADCDLMIKIYEDYFDKFFQNKNPDAIKKLIWHSIKTIKKNLLINKHGKFFKPYIKIE